MIVKIEFPSNMNRIIPLLISVMIFTPVHGVWKIQFTNIVYHIFYEMSRGFGEKKIELTKFSRKFYVIIYSFSDPVALS